MGKLTAWLTGWRGDAALRKALLKAEDRHARVKQFCSVSLAEANAARQTAERERDTARADAAYWQDESGALRQRVAELEAAARIHAVEVEHLTLLLEAQRSIVARVLALNVAAEETALRGRNGEAGYGLLSVEEGE